MSEYFENIRGITLQLKEHPVLNVGTVSKLPGEKDAKDHMTCEVVSRNLRHSLC